MKKLVLVFFLFVLVTACSSKPSREYVDFSEEDYQLCTIGEYTVHLPKGYEFNDLFGNGGKGPGATWYNYTSNNLTYMVYMFPEPSGEERTADKFKESKVESYKSIYDSFELKSFNEISIDGESAFRIDYVAADEGKTGYYAEVYLLKDDRYYIFSMFDEGSSSSDYLSDFQGVLDSIKKG